MTKQKPDYKLDIFSTIGSLSKKNPSFFHELSEDQQKALHPLVVMRWLTGTTDARQIYFLNELVNPFVFSIPNHKEVIVDLLSISCSGTPRRYRWVKTKTKKHSNMSLTTKTISEFFGYSLKQAKDAIPILSNSDIIGYAEQLGKQSDEIKQIKKEIQSRVK